MYIDCLLETTKLSSFIQTDTSTLELLAQTRLLDQLGITLSPSVDDKGGAESHSSTQSKGNLWFP